MEGEAHPGKVSQAPVRLSRTTNANEGTRSNILSDVPTNSQLILRLLRDAEHRRRPLPPPNEAELAGQAEDDDTDEDDSEEEEEGESNVGEKIKKIRDKMGNGVRAKTRRAWDRAGNVKEEVS